MIVSAAIIPITLAVPDQNTMTLKSTHSFSDPIMTIKNTMTTISIPETDSYIISPGAPKIPKVVETFEFTPGTIITDIHCEMGSVQWIPLDYQIEHSQAFQSISSDKKVGSSQPDPLIYHSAKAFPSSQYDVQTGAGLNDEGDHVLFVSVPLYPIQYLPLENTLSFTSNMSITISYQEPLQPLHWSSTQDATDLLIITPDHFIPHLSFFIENKTRHGLSVSIQSLETIYSQFQGKDKCEKIKRCIYDAVSTKDCSYVLLLGDLHLLPIRVTDAYPWSPYHGSGILTDLYYSDVYDASFEFSNWDADNDGIYGEVDFEHSHQMPGEEGNIDEVDLFADVHIGRIPCSTADELKTVLQKICFYEEITAYQLWFNKIILAGGDTFPLTKGSPLNVFEGEITNTKVAQQLPGFDKVFLWASTKNLNARSFNNAISQGAGFVSYAGHGFEHGWGTYRPNAIIDGNLIIYFTPFLKRITNEWKTPIIFFDACLTAKLDFNISDLIAYYGLRARLPNLFLRFQSSDYFPSFAWAFLKKADGGAIATVGATRPAYTHVDKYGVYAGAGYLDVRFFHSYEEGITVGEMLTQSQNDYINYVMKDFFTVEEYILFGDPSMMAGGYP